MTGSANHPGMANLRPWKPGQSGNPRGRQRAGANIWEWLNVLMEQDEHDRGRFTRAQIEKLAADPDEAPAKIAAWKPLIDPSMNISSASA